MRHPQILLDRIVEARDIGDLGESARPPTSTLVAGRGYLVRYRGPRQSGAALEESQLSLSSVSEGFERLDHFCHRRSLFEQ